jgi:hypothetical protein
VSGQEYANSTAMKTKANTRSIAENSACPVRKLRIVSSSRTRATVCPVDRVSK